jgi:signal transduction histidine kinase
MEALPEAGANQLLDRLLTQGAGAAVGIDPAGVEVLMAGQRIPMAGWIILASLPTTEAFAPIQAMQQRMLLAATIFTLLAVGLIGWVLRRQLSPLLTSIEMLAEMAGNKRPTQPLPIARQDEIGQLLAAFNQLLERLQQREAALKESESRWRFDYATLQRIFDALPVGIWIADTEGRLKINNPAGHEIWQGERWVGPEAYGEYKGWWSANGRPLAAQDWAMARTLATGETSIDEMIDIECFDGSRKTILNSATMIVDADGRPSCALVVNQDITALKAVQDDLTQAGRQLAALSGELLAVQERERQALSHELHDEIGQSLTALRITLETARRGAVEPEMTTLAYAISIVDTLLDDVREIARGLRPSQLDELGLLPALRWHVDKIGQTTGLHCALESDIGDRRFLPALELACFRTAQEAITNALRHAQASEINLSLTLTDDGLQLSVRDNGVGFDGADLRHTPLGLLGMRERVAGLCGTLRIDSAPGAGTKIFATFPLEILS